MKSEAWVKKRERARFVEEQILKWYRQNRDADARLVQGYFEDYDIYSKKGCVEIKEDRMAHQTGNYALEYETHDGKPSGYMGTKAEFFVIVDWEYVSLVATQVLKDVVNSFNPKKTVLMGEVFDDGRKNKGYLLPREAILNNPLVSVYKRWFPVYDG